MQLTVDGRMNAIHPVHPFPARMAPEIALEETAQLAAGSLVLDPMAGSGTVLRTASERGHRAYGCDMDPLAVLMARVWTTPLDPHELREAAIDVVTQAKTLNPDKVSLPWIDEDPQAQVFIDYWFGKEQQGDLRRLSSVLSSWDGAVGDALKIGLSRIIVTKDRGASLARDVSHSRPHRVRDTNDFPVMSEFQRSVQRLSQRLADQPPRSGVTVARGDARHLEGVATASVDAVITSPPYLNAIDYIRGHRLALVWLGQGLSTLRSIRSNSIGAERMPNVGSDNALAKELSAAMEPINQLPDRIRRMIDRYVLDLFAMIAEIHRVLRPEGRAVFVVGNSCVKGVFVKNALAVSAAAERAGFCLFEQHEHDLPPAQRYLPPPEKDAPNLEKRMRTETVFTYIRS